MDKKERKIWLAIAIGVALLILINGGYINQLFAVYYSPSCDFITNVEDGIYESGWIAVDVNSDGLLEGYDYSGKSGLLSSCTSSGRTLTGIQTVEGYEVVLTSSNTPNICIPSGIKFSIKYYNNPSSVAEITCPADEPEFDCSPGESSCQVNQLVECGSDLFWNDPLPLEIGVCGVECLIDSDCGDFNTCSNNACSFDQDNLNEWLLSQTDLNTISISELESRIDALELDAEAQGILINLIDEKIDLSISELGILITGLQSDATAQGILISNLELSISDLNNLITDLQTESLGQAGIISQLGLDIQDLADLITTIQTDILGQATLISDLDLDIQGLGVLLGEMDLSISDLETMFEALDLTVQEQGEAMSAMDLRITEIETFIAGLPSFEEQAEFLNGLNASLTETAALVDSLSLSINDQAIILANLDLSNQDLITLTSEMQTDITTLQEELGFTQEQIDDIYSQLGNLSYPDTGDTEDPDTINDFNEFFEEYKFWIIGILIFFAMIVLISPRSR